MLGHKTHLLNCKSRCRLVRYLHRKLLNSQNADHLDFMHQARWQLFLHQWVSIRPGPALSDFRQRRLLVLRLSVVSRDHKVFLFPETPIASLQYQWASPSWPRGPWTLDNSRVLLVLECSLMIIDFCDLSMARTAVVLVLALSNRNQFWEEASYLVRMIHL